MTTTTSALQRPEAAVLRADTFARDPDRLEVLHRTGLLGAGLQESLQRFVKLASDLTGAPMALVSLTDADRQYFSGAHGVELEQTPLEASYCKHVVADNIQLSVEDSHADAVLAHNAATTGMGIRAYLGSPICAGGTRLGALCVSDTEPRKWDERQRRFVHDLAQAVGTDIELRLHANATARMANTDPLTGLGNRRALASALYRVFKQRRSVVVAAYDLNGFKAYNDAFGHPAGDDLLIRIAARLKAVCGPLDEVFRTGGDEFFMIGQARERLMLAQHVLEDRGPGYTISAAIGIVELPYDASDGTSAIALADQRMYGAKPSRSVAVDFTVSKVLQRALEERGQDLGGHPDYVSGLAVATATELGLDHETVRTIETAGRLHDIGKMAISDAILTKPGALSPQEWEQIKRHPVIGERILTAAPAMTQAARLIRASHERVDGRGYPDALAGDQIPIGARIIFACDALDAMTRERSYRPRMLLADALQELDRNAGTQFDPQVAAAILRAHAKSEPADH